MISDIIPIAFLNARYKNNVCMVTACKNTNINIEVRFTVKMTLMVISLWTVCRLYTGKIRLIFILGLASTRFRLTRPSLH